ncbi:MAG: DUF4127 family protein [Lachnospiraceae bacterium]|nr:DUF4127 family protein [Lachnospiraceae bacterium]
MKILLLPLDERPCNAAFPERLFPADKVQILLPRKLGHKKKPADFSVLSDFLFEKAKDADALLLSLDMLLYGGLIPSRLHHLKTETLFSRLHLIRELKEKYPALPIYAFATVMRCPAYSSADEEPDYYERFGSAIHARGALMHRTLAGLTTSSEAEDTVPSPAGLLPAASGEGEIDASFSSVPADTTSAEPVSASSLDDGDSQDPEPCLSSDFETCLADYLARRALNKQLSLQALELVKEGILESIVFPQDDSMRFGFPAMDQEEIRRRILTLGLTESAMMYPGSDEIALTLLCRILLKHHGLLPKVYVKYLTDDARSLIPLYEGLPLSATTSYQLHAAGCVTADTCAEADIVLLETAPSGSMEEAWSQPSRSPSYFAERNFPEMLSFIKRMRGAGKVVTVADNAYANGGDLDLIRILDADHLLMDLQGYAGWNTNANTMGCAIAMGVCAFLYGEQGLFQDPAAEAHRRNFLISRYIEDACYQADVRQCVTKKIPPLGFDYFFTGEDEGEVRDLILAELQIRIKTELSSLADRIQIRRLTLPWKRMFEIDLEALLS